MVSYEVDMGFKENWGVEELEIKIKELDLKIAEHLNPPRGLIFNPILYNVLFFVNKLKDVRN